MSMASERIRGQIARLVNPNPDWNRSLDHSQPRMCEAREAFLTIPQWFIVVLAVAVALYALAGLSRQVLAHDSSHPEWNSWLMSQQNQNNAICCDGNDAFTLGDNEWRTNNDHYEVFHDGAWQAVPEWALTKGNENITGSALLWIWHGHVRCFKPGTFY
jgi:hypothetical protein